MLDVGHEHSRGLPPTIPPPEWIYNVTCYSPLLLDDHLALEKSTLTTGGVIKTLLIVTSTTLSIVLNFVFLVRSFVGSDLACLLALIPSITRNYGFKNSLYRANVTSVECVQLTTR